MRILLTGATGFVGKSLCVELLKRGHTLTLVSRRAERLKSGDWGLPTEFLAWDALQGPCPIPLDPFEAVINLVGEPVADARWTPDQKKSIYDSRVLTTQRLGEAIAQRQGSPLRCLISASAVGYYPFDTEATYDESGPAGDSFLSQVCRDWEAAAREIKGVERLALLRIGVVLGSNAGALEQMKQPFQWGVGGPLGSGEQKVSWIHRADLVQIIAQALEDKAYQGPINCVAPEIVSNRQLSQTLARVLAKPCGLAAPAAVLKAALGERSIVVLGSQAVASSALPKVGYTFLYPDLQSALVEACSRIADFDGGLRRFSAVQFVPRPLGEVFDFFCDPHNLERITPPLLSFKIEKISTPRVEEGTIIHYRLKVHGMPMKWRTLIRQWEPNRSFVDFQEAGPYRIWHHTHSFTAVPGGTLMEDEVRYKLPVGMLGDVFGHPLVKRDVKAIFAYRRQVIDEVFGA